MSQKKSLDSNEIQDFLTQVSQDPVFAAGINSILKALEIVTTHLEH